MKTSIEIANRTKKRISTEFVKNVIRKTVKLSGIKVSDFSVSVVFLGKSEIRKLNRKYRRICKPTDILSFNYSLGYNKGGIEAGPPATLRKRALARVAMRAGELALCPEVIAGHAKKNKVAFQKELSFVLSHGVLHLLGFRHGKRMYGIQDIVSSKFKYQNVK